MRKLLIGLSVLLICGLSNVWADTDLFLKDEGVIAVLTDEGIVLKRDIFIDRPYDKAYGSFESLVLPAGTVITIGTKE